ncbi:retrovirus-related Pol polyprotein from transposon 17.6 [Trichonephila clavipes]|nr:retrovirus-related Pol polyprotein from transposon 17.6 [Trichonephila clavipes]
MTVNKIQVHGKANVTLRFGNIDYHHTAYIADITNPCILVLDFLKNNNFKLDFENSNMHSKIENITLFGLQTQFESNQKIIAKSKLSLPPRTEYIIPGLVAENRKFRFGLIDYPDPDSLKAGVVIASSGSRPLEFSHPNLTSRYWQVKLHPHDKEKSAFTTGQGLWHFKVMPFGLCNAPATFERLMEKVLGGLSYEACLVYLYDIIIMRRSFEEHMKSIRRVLQKLKEANLKLSPSKCHLFRHEVTYLGHIISAEGVRTDPGKISAVKDWNCPTDVH